jgi:hypothetical protein
MAGPPPLDTEDVWRHAVSVPLRLPPEVGKKDVEEAAARLIRRFPTLRARFVRSGPEQFRQEIPSVPRLDSADAAELPAVEPLVVTMPSGDDHLSEERIGEIRQHRDIPNMAVLLPPPRTPGGRAVLTVPHAFVDAGGAAALAAACHEEVTTPSRGPEDRTLHHIVEFERSEPGRRASRSAIDHLLSMARSADELNLTGSSVPQGRHDGFGIKGSGRWLAATLMSMWPGSRTSRAAALLALILIAYRRLFGDEKFWMALRTANRSTPGELSFVGLTTRFGWLIDGAQPGMDFRRLVRRVSASLMESTAHSRYEPSAATRALTEAGLTRCPTYYFNYWEAPDIGQAGEESLPGDSWELDPSLFEHHRMPFGIYEFEFNCYVEKGIATLVVKYDGDCYLREDAERLVSFLKTAIPVIKKDPRVRVADLLELG